MISSYDERGAIHNTENINLDGRFIYYIIKDDEVIYIGQTTSLTARITNHKTSFDFDEFRVAEVSDSVRLDDIEFMQIIEHRPRHNLGLPTPSFLICKTTLSRMIDKEIQAVGCNNLAYNINSPDFTFEIGDKEIKYWIDRSVKNYNDNHVMLIRLISELENK